MAAFKRRFPQATEHGAGGMCSATACTSPALFVSGLTASEVQAQDETWSPCLQEVALECGMDGALATLGVLGTDRALCACTVFTRRIGAPATYADTPSCKLL